MRKAVLTAAAVACVVLLGQAAGQQGAGAAVDVVFGAFDRPDSPGCAVATYKDGKIEYERGYGMASLEHDLPITPASVFYVGSVSKQFTAFAAALAIRDGQLSLDDTIRRYLPELPDYASSIAVRHLIHHTSGLRDYNTLLSIAGRRGDEAFDNDTVLRITARQKKLNFEPGSEYLYSNTGYTLLATIVERATKTPFADYAERKMFEPLGMAVTHFHVDESRLVKNRAFAFSRQATALVLDTPSNERAGAGGVFSNVRDLHHWDENFYTGRVGGRALIEQVQTPGRLNDGTVLSYAWGLQIGKYRGLKLVEHSGSLGGYRAHLMRFPDEHYGLAALCNMSSSTPATLLRQVADARLSARFTEPKPKPSAAAAGSGGGQRGGTGAARAAAPAARAEDYAGTFYSEELEATFAVITSENRVLLRRDSDREATELQPSGADEFRFRGMTVRFERDENKKVTALAIDAGRVRDVRFVKRASEKQS